MVLCALFAALIAVGAYIRIPTPLAPVTLQTMFVTMSGLVLGWKYATVSALIYVCLGLVGLPVFAGGGGVSYLLNPTFGYIMGFVVCAALSGLLSEKIACNNFRKNLLCSCIGLIPVYVIGVGYFAVISYCVSEAVVNLSEILLWGAAIFLPGDLIMCVIASFLSVKLKKAIRF